MTVDAAEASTHLRAQWQHLHGWLRGLGGTLDAAVGGPSVLDGWNVGELVSHLGRAMGALTACSPAPPGTVPLTLAEYLGSYPEGAEAITRVTRDLDGELASDRVGGIARLADHAFTRLDELAGAHVVQARRGAITLRDMVVSRLLELVVHADDLARSLPHVQDDPVDRAALQVIADELLAIVVARGGWSLEVLEPRLWVRLACGREPYDVDQLARALGPVHTSEAVPDLGRTLPLL